MIVERSSVASCFCHDHPNRYLVQLVILEQLPKSLDHSNVSKRRRTTSKPSCNPYLAFAVTLAAGLKGIQDELPLEPPTEDPTLFTCTRHELNERGIRTLPDTLGDAVELFASSELMREVLGEHIHSYLVEAKRAEWNEYQKSVSAWELDHYLGVL